MTLNQILKYVNYICVKENSGSTLTPDQFNTILVASNISMFNKYVSQAQLLSMESKVPFNEVLFNMASLREFHVKEDVTITAGSFNLTDLLHSFAYWGSMVTLFGGTYKKIEIVTDKEFSDRRSNLLNKQLKDYPVVIFFGDDVNIYPTNITSAEFIFMKNPVTPKFDYYIDANANMVYLGQGTSHALGTSETGSLGQTTGTVTSLTVELEWNELYHVDFCNEILSRVGVSLKDEQLKQYIREVEGKQV